MLEKPNFDLAEKCARWLRFKQPKKDLALNVLNMEFPNLDGSIVFDTFENYANAVGCNVLELTAYGTLQDGYTVKYETPLGTKYLILYSKRNACSQRLNWTLAHEIGHIYLKHSSDGKKQEIEANWFAAELLMPAPIIYGFISCDVIVDTLFLQQMFGVSYDAASKRISSLNRMPMYSSYLEDEFIDRYGQLVELLSTVCHKRVI